MKNFYDTEIARVKEKMVVTDPSTKDYFRLLLACERLDVLKHYAKELDAPEIPGQISIADVLEKRVEEEHIEQKPVEKEPVKEETPLPWVDSTPFPDPPVTNEPKELTREYVRSLLRDATMRGVTIAPILQQFVPEGKPFKFSEVPVSKYPELVEVLSNA